MQLRMTLAEELIAEMPAGDLDVVPTTMGVADSVITIINSVDPALTVTTSASFVIGNLIQCLRKWLSRQDAPVEIICKNGSTVVTIITTNEFAAPNAEKIAELIGAVVAHHDVVE